MGNRVMILTSVIAITVDVVNFVSILLEITSVHVTPVIHWEETAKLVTTTMNVEPITVDVPIHVLTPSEVIVARVTMVIHCQGTANHVQM